MARGRPPIKLAGAALGTQRVTTPRLDLPQPLPARRPAAGARIPTVGWTTEIIG